MNIKSISAIPKTTPYQSQKTLRENNAKSTNIYTNPAKYSLNFAGNYDKNLIDIPIQNNKEFYKVMRRVMRSKVKPANIFELLNPFRERVWIDRRYRKEYPVYKNASEIEMGLIPYCGEYDNSEMINMFLSGRLEKDTLNHHARMPKNEKTCIDVVRTLDYSLKELDKEFGTYGGIVYRVGYMSENGSQYFSTSKSLAFIERNRLPSYNFNPHVGYSVIKLKNGHKIYEFQRKMGSSFATTEEEVLTDRNSKFKKLLQEEMDEELLNAREELAKNLFYGAEEVMEGLNSSYYMYNRESLLRFINVFEEIDP